MHQAAFFLFFLLIGLFWAGPAMTPGLMNINIAGSILAARPTVCSTDWGKYYIDVTEFFRSTVNGMHFSNFISELQYLNNLNKSKFDEQSYNIGEIYVFGIIGGSFLCGINIFSLNWDVAIKVKYLGHDQIELIEARVIDKTVWP
ncbi:hypothetical protein [Xanthobacter pseudotagetidis]|uniref:hypothetical protein n=1 Tax=Xanthobacter pseudotagetidis TaxID=3119911 RepID=UPI00372914DB